MPFHFDDTTTIVENSELKDLSNFWPPTTSRWFGFLTFALNYHFGGLNTIGYHAVNLTIHIFNAILVYWLVMLTFRTPYFKVSVISASVSNQPNQFNRPTFKPLTYLPLFIALIFVSHPIQTQAVTYIVQRFTSLATMFYLLSLVMYIKFRSQQSVAPGDSPRRAINGQQKLHAARYTLYIVSSISAILAMFTKEIAFTLPVTIMLYEFMFFKEEVKKRILYLIPFIFTMLIIPLSRVNTDKPLDGLIGNIGEATKELTTMSRWDYLFTQFRVVVTYIRLLFLPINQNVDYDYPIYTSFINPKVFLSFLFLLSIFGLGVYLLYKSRSTYFAWRLAAFGIFWFFTTLSVESSIIPIRDVIFEHRMYLPSVGLFFAIITFIFFLADKLKSRWQKVNRAVVVTLAAVIAVLSITTFARNIIWHDWVSLWEDVINKSPGKGRSFDALGAHYIAIGDYANAIKNLKEAINRHPLYANLYLDLAIAYQRSGDLDNEILAYQRVIYLGKGDVKVYIDLGDAFFKKLELNKALKEFETALSLAPQNAHVHSQIGLVYRAYKNYEDAIDYLRKAVSLEPQNPYYHGQLADVYLLAERPKEAIQELSECLQLDPGNIIYSELLKQARQKIHSE